MPTRVFGILLLLVTVAQTATVRRNLDVRHVPFNPDGYPRPVYGVFDMDLPRFPNGGMLRPFPGPELRATAGDTMEVTFHNNLKDQVISIHWHGLHLQNNPWADGVYRITECGIQPGTSFTYTFVVEHVGTHWYHSHAGLQYGDGLYGPLIVEPRGEDPITVRYKPAHEYNMMVQDWFHDEASLKAISLVGPAGAFEGFHTRSPRGPVPVVLINGRGQFNCSKAATFAECRARGMAACAVLRDPYLGSCNETNAPPDTYQCAKGRNVRLRITNAAAGLDMRFWVDQHEMMIVARDGVNLVPTDWVQSIPLGPGHRVDAIIRCNRLPSQKYKIFTSSAGASELSSFAWLEYAGATDPVPADVQWPPGTEFPDSGRFEDTPLQEELRVAPPADERIYVLYHNTRSDEPGEPFFSWRVNNRSFVPPREPVLQTVYTGGRRPWDDLAEQTKTHATVVLNLLQGRTYEIVLHKLGGVQWHPWHIHGHSAHLTEIAVPPDARDERFQEWYDENGPPLGEPVRSTVGDSWNVDPGKSVAIRFNASNQGPWMLHCHVEWHFMTGQALVLNVEPSQGAGYPDISPPPDNLAMCGQQATWGQRPSNV